MMIRRLQPIATSYQVGSHIIRRCLSASSSLCSSSSPAPESASPSSATEEKAFSWKSAEQQSRPKLLYNKQQQQSRQQQERQPTAARQALFKMSADQQLKEKIEQERSQIDPSFQRDFDPNSTYDPFDFSLTKLRLERTQYKNLTKSDRFKQLNVNPLSLWKDDMMLSNFITSNGKILPGHMTGLKGKTQKRLAKAIRRSRAAGLLSTVHRSVERLPTEPHVDVRR